VEFFFHFIIKRFNYNIIFIVVIKTFTITQILLNIRIKLNKLIKYLKNFQYFMFIYFFVRNKYRILVWIINKILIIFIQVFYPSLINCIHIYLLILLIITLIIITTILIIIIVIIINIWWLALLMVIFSIFMRILL
jgi:hypothetical protein